MSVCNVHHFIMYLLSSPLPSSTRCSYQGRQTGSYWSRVQRVQFRYTVWPTSSQAAVQLHYEGMCTCVYACVCVVLWCAHMCTSSWGILVFQRDLQSGVSLQTVSRAAGLTENLQLDQFFTILQVKGNYLITTYIHMSVRLSVYFILRLSQLNHPYPLFSLSSSPPLFPLLSSLPPLLHSSPFPSPLFSSYLSFPPLLSLSLSGECWSNGCA